MAEQQAKQEFIHQGVLEGHTNWVTCIASGHSQKENEDSNVLVTGSRDKSLIIWKLYEGVEDNKYGQAYKKLTGHSHFISDLALTSNNGYALTSSWDKSLRLWDLRKGTTAYRFEGHTKEVFTCAISADNRQILSAGADKKIILWNNIGQKKYESEDKNHQDWVSCVRYSPQIKSSKGGEQPPYFATVGWDGRLKIWNTNIQIKYTFKAHDSNVNSLSISPNGKYVATGGKDKKLYVWDTQNLTNYSREFDAGSTIFQIAFNPKLQWVAAATEQGVKVWDLMSTSNKSMETLSYPLPQVQRKEGEKVVQPKLPMSISVAWNALGKKLFAGFTNGNIQVWHISGEASQ